LDLTSLNNRLNVSTSRLRKKIETTIDQLASGNRLTSAQVDTASLSVASTLRNHIESTRAVQSNVTQAISLFQVADSGLSNVQELLLRMKSLSVQASSDGITQTERGYLDIELQALKKEIDRLAETTNFNGTQVLNGYRYEGITQTILGTNAGETVLGSEIGETINAFGGNDLVLAGAGDDIINAGSDGTVPIPPGAAVVIAANDASSLTLNGGAVQSINDTSGNGNTAFQNVASSQPRLIAQGGSNVLDFDGINDHLNVNNTGDINDVIHPLRSIFLNFTTSDDISNRQYIYEEGAQVNGFSFHINNNNLYVGAWRNNGADFDHFLSVPISTFTTYTAGFVFDSTANTFTAYLDGAVIGVGVVNQPQARHTGDITFGASGGRGYNELGADNTNAINDFFKGQIGDFALYNDALDAAEVAQITAAIGQPGGASGGLDGNDTIDGGLGTDTVTYSGNFSDYSIEQDFNGDYIITDTRVGSPNGTDILSNVELLQFNDGGLVIGSSIGGPEQLTFDISGVGSEVLEYTFVDATLDSLFDDPGDIILGTRKEAELASTEIDKAINAVTSMRAYVGSLAQRSDYIANNAAQLVQNQTNAHSALTDTDILATSTEFASLQVHLAALEPKSSVSTNSTTSAQNWKRFISIEFGFVYRLLHQPLNLLL